MDLIYPAAHRGSIRRVQTRDRLSKTCADPDNQDLAHLAQGPGVGLSYVAVALGSGQGWQRIHQVHNVRVQRGLVGKRGEQAVERLGQIGEQAALHRMSQLDQGPFVDDLFDPHGSGRLHRGSPHGCLDNGHRVLRFPSRLPGLTECALTLHRAFRRRDPLQPE